MLNINVGLLGHVDSGKTSLAKALSQTASTAAFDKSPQSQSRGITLDLGFSACEVTPETASCAGLLTEARLDKVACTFVDCPGHASLIRTVVGGSQIIDVMVLLIDATKGIQPQTAECLVLGEVLAKPLVVVINKVDAVQGSTAEDKKAALAKLRKRLQATFAQTRWPNVPMVEVSASPRGGSGAGDHPPPANMAAVLPAVLSVANLAALRARSDFTSSAAVAAEKKKFLMLVDHCFAVRGQGTVFTGTVLGGLVAVADTVLIPELQETRKVKSLQVFKRSVGEAKAGDRVGLCVAQFDSTQMERGALCSGSDASAAAVLEKTDTLIVRVHRVRFHPMVCDSHTKFHITIGHTTVMGTMRYFSRPTSATGARFDPQVESTYEDQLGDEAHFKFDTAAQLPPGQPLPVTPGDREYFAILLLEQPVYAATGATFVAMRLDVEKENFCRIAVSGAVVVLLHPTTATAAGGAPPAWRTLPIVRVKQRPLRVDRVVDARTCIADGVVIENVSNTTKEETPSHVGKKHAKGAAGDGPALKSKDTMHAEAQKFVGLKVLFIASPDFESACASGTPAITGVIDSTFGKTGKVKLSFKQDLFVTGAGAQKKRAPAGGGSAEASPLLLPGEIVLPMRRYPFALHSSMRQ